MTDSLGVALGKSLLQLRTYRCPDCKRAFYVDGDAPQSMDGIVQERDFLSCPWCEGVSTEATA